MEESYEDQKQARLARKLELEKRREEILIERARLISLKNQTDGRRSISANSFSSSHSLSTAIDRATKQIPEFERRVQTLRKENEVRSNALRRPYNGEMGIGSYEPWQLEHFYFVRDFVRSWVDEVLDFVVREPPKAKRDHEMETVADRFFEELEAEKKNDKLVQMSLDIDRSIVTEVIHQTAKETASEILSLENEIRSMIDSIVLGAFDLQTSKSAGNNRNSLVGNAFLQLKKERNKRKEVWAHTQAFQLRDSSTGAEAIVEEEEETFDGTVLYFHDIIPFSDILDTQLPIEQLEFQNQESEYWMANSVDLSTLPLPRRYKGISCSAVSSNDCLIALGTVQGDILIWDLLVYPPRILRTSRGKNASVTELQWSMNSTQVVSLNERGVVQIWSLADSITVPYEEKSFEPMEQNLGFKTSALVCLLTLEPNDFFFTMGPFADSKELVTKVTTVTFHPSSTLLGKQGYLMVGLDKGNILRLKCSDSSVQSFPQVQPSNGVSHKIGKDIEAELFKSHNHRIVLISFVNNISPMVTVDDEGFISLWEYSSESLTGFGWFVPFVKYRLHLAEVTYEPVVAVDEKVIFTDAISGPSRKQQRQRQEMIQRRKQIQKHIKSLHLGKPWKTDEVDDKVTHVYAPKNVPQSGATFHCVTYNTSSGLLACYVTRPYKPTEVPCSRFISCQSNSAGTKLIFMLLFPDAVPREAHVSFVIVNLDPVVVSKNYMCVGVSEQDYAKCVQGSVCSFGISRAVDATGSEYIITNVNSNISAISMTTGNEVMAQGEQGWVGCHLNLKKGQVPAASQVQAASTCKGLQLVFYAKKHNSAVLLQVRDYNTKEQRMETWQSFQRWVRGEHNTHPMLHTMRRFSWTFSGHSDIHAECLMESLVLDMMDDAIQIVDGPFSSEQRQTFHVQNIESPFLRRTSVSSEDRNSEALSVRSGGQSVQSV